MLTESVYREEYQPGAHIYREGEPGTAAYVIERGRVEISALRQGRKITVAMLGEGDLFGEMAMLDTEMHGVTALALEETVVVVIGLDQLREKFEQADPLLTFIMRNTLERLRITQSRLIDVSGPAEEEGPFAAVEAPYNRHRERAMRKLRFEDQINRGLEEGEFSLNYQPVVVLKTGRLAGVEALLRWDHPERGPLYPDDFIGTAEETGLIIPLGQWVLEQACNALLSFQKRQDALSPDAIPLYMAINLSSRQFSDIDLVRNISAIIDATAVNPEQIKLEITESLLMDNPARAAVTLNGVKALGLEIAIDDFGTGYSSLSYLHRFQIDTLKIDRSFIATMGMNAGSMEVVRAVAGLARNLGLDIVCEGIEQPEQVTTLRDLGCEYGQGFFFSKPVEAEHILARIDRESGAAKLAVGGATITPIGS